MSVHSRRSNMSVSSRYGASLKSLEVPVDSKSVSSIGSRHSHQSHRSSCSHRSCKSSASNRSNTSKILNQVSSQLSELIKVQQETLKASQQRQPVQQSYIAPEVHTRPDLSLSSHRNQSVCGSERLRTIQEYQEPLEFVSGNCPKCNGREVSCHSGVAGVGSQSRMCINGHIWSTNSSGVEIDDPRQSEYDSLKYKNRDMISKGWGPWFNMALEREHVIDPEERARGRL